MAILFAGMYALSPLGGTIVAGFCVAYGATLFVAHDFFLGVGFSLLYRGTPDSPLTRASEAIALDLSLQHEIPKLQRTLEGRQERRKNTSQPVLDSSQQPGVFKEPAVPFSQQVTTPKQGALCIM